MFRPDWLDQQPHAGRALLELQGFEMRLQHAKEHLRIASRRWHREDALVRGVVFQRQGENEPCGDAMRRFQPERELLEKTPENEKQWLRRFDLVLEIERFG